MIRLTHEMRDRIDGAAANGTPCILATASAGGQPSLGYKGSMMAYDDEHLAYWEATRRVLLRHVEENPRVAVLYSDRAAQVHWRFYGEATIHKAGPVREQIKARTAKAELDRDPERRGYGVLIRVDRVMSLGGTVIQQRE